MHVRKTPSYCKLVFLSCSLVPVLVIIVVVMNFLELNEVALKNWQSAFDEKMSFVFWGGGADVPGCV
jgi:hypothetical protein